MDASKVDFDKQITVMMGGFPGYFLTPERLESYWRGLQKMSMSSLIRVVDFVLSEDGPEKIPSVSAMWDIYRKLKSVRVDNRVAVDVGMSRAQHLMHLRRLCIENAKRETMPMHKGYVIGWECAPDHVRARLKMDWEQWENEHGQKTDSDWWPRARELMIQAGEKTPDEVAA